MQHRAPVVYAYQDVDTLLREEAGSRRKTGLPGASEHPPTERPD
jgi:hypothetical protein